jgi:mono/diheme cytochrome c family protein
VGNQYVAVAPLPVDAHTLRHGEERFNIHCAPCHDRAGSGRGPVVRKGYPPALDLSSVRARAMSDGQVYDTLVHGVRNMPARGYALTVHDRWAVVAWVRVLQRSQHATWGELSQEERDVLAAPGGQP